LTELADDFGAPVEYQNRRLALTGSGTRLLEKLKAVLAIGQEMKDSEPTEVMRVAIAEIVAELLSVTGKDFFQTWEGLVALQFLQLDLQTISETVRSGYIAFAIGLEGDEVVGNGEMLEPGLRWVAAIPANAMSSLQGSVSVAQLAKHRLFLPPSAVRSPRLTELLTITPLSQQVHMDSSSAALAMAAAGLGVGMVLDSGSPASGSESLRRLPVSGIEPQRICLYAGKADSLSQPALDLMDAIRAAVRKAALPEIPSFDNTEETIEALPLPDPLPA
jgi:DNA-binding transcriptional LysR family regulator